METLVQYLSTPVLLKALVLIVCSQTLLLLTYRLLRIIKDPDGPSLTAEETVCFVALVAGLVYIIQDML